MKILVINGPNLNMLGIREPGIYGKSTYADLCRLLEQTAKDLGMEVEIYKFIRFYHLSCPPECHLLSWRAA